MMYILVYISVQTSIRITSVASYSQAAFSILVVCFVCITRDILITRIVCCLEKCFPRHDV